MLTPNIWFKFEQGVTEVYHITSQLNFFPFFDFKFQFFLCRNNEPRIQEHLVLRWKLLFFYSRLVGLILHWFIAAIKEVKILGHLRVVLTDYTNLRKKSHFNGKLSKLTRLRKKNRNISHTRPPFCCIHMDAIKKQHYKFSPSQAEIEERTHNFPLKRLFYHNDLPYFSCFTREILASLFKIFEVSFSCREIVT